MTGWLGLNGGRAKKLGVAVEVGVYRSVTHAPFHWHHGKYGVTEIKMVSQPSGTHMQTHARCYMFLADVADRQSPQVGNDHTCPDRPGCLVRVRLRTGVREPAPERVQDTQEGGELPQ